MMMRFITSLVCLVIFWIALVYVPRDPDAGWNDIAYNEACPRGFQYLALGRSTADRLMCCRIFCLVGRGDEWRLDQGSHDAILKIFPRATKAAYDGRDI